MNAGDPDGPPPEVNLTDAAYVGDCAKAHFDVFMARGFTREEAFRLVIEVVRGGYQQAKEK